MDDKHGNGDGWITGKGGKGKAPSSSSNVVKRSSCQQPINTSKAPARPRPGR